MAIKLKLKSLRPQVEIFGEKYKLPYFTNSIGDRLTEEQRSLDVRQVIDDEYPGATRCFSDMMYLNLMVEYKKSVKDYSIQTHRVVEIDGQKYEVKFSDIIPVHNLVHELDGVKYVFREVSALEWAKLGSPRHTDILNYAFLHLEYEGQKYKLDETEEGALPYSLCFVIQEIMGTIQLKLGDKTVTGVDKIEELFITGKL